MEYQSEPDHIPPLPAASPLTHDHPQLTAAAWQDPSDLLCSLLPASLSTVAQQLSTFDQLITEELQAVVDTEHRDFIALASKLGGEKHRIDRLTHWAGAHPQPQDRDLRQSNGLEGIRRQVDYERSRIQDLQADVQDLLHTKQHVDERTANLHLLLSFSDALHRLETLMGVVPAHSKQYTDPDEAAPHFDDGDNGDDNDQDIALTSPSVSSLDAASDDDGYSSSGTSPSSDEPLHRIGASSNDPLQKPLASRRRTAGAPDLPSKIHRAKSSWEALDFLRKAALADLKAQSPPLSTAFLDAHAHRLHALRVSIKADCASLLKRLLQPGSLLVGSLEFDDDRDDSNLKSWSQIDSQKYNDRSEVRAKVHNERRAWLFLVMDTWLRLDSDRESAVEEIRNVIRSETIQSWASKNIAADRATSGKGKAQRRDLAEEAEPYRSSPFTPLFNGILAYVRTLTDLLTLLEEFDGQTSSSGLSSPPHSLRAFETIVWTEIANVLIDQVGGQLFFVGRLQEFRANYQTTCAFLDALAELAPSDRARRSWRAQASYTSFMKRWQLSVYFQMRYRSIAGKLERDMQSAPSFPGGHVSVPPLLSSTKGAVEALTSPWANDSHLDALVPRQWKLSMLVASRFDSWLRELLPESIRSGVYAKTATELSHTHTSVRDSSGSATPDAEAQSKDDETLRLLSVLVVDAMWFQTQLKEKFDESIAVKLHTSDAQTEGNEALIGDLKDSLLECFTFEQDVLPAITNRITDVLKARTAEPLRLVRSVNTSSYRPTTTAAAARAPKETLPEASYFIPQIFRPLKTFFGKSGASATTTAAQLVPQAIKVQWAVEVIDDVATRYAASLTQMIQNYESLKRLKRGGGPSATGAGGGFSGFATSWLGKTGANSSGTTQKGSGLPEEDPEAKRMQLQMRADVERLEEDIAELAEVGVAVDLKALASWQSLQKVIEGHKTV